MNQTYVITLSETEVMALLKFHHINKDQIKSSAVFPVVDQIVAQTSKTSIQKEMDEFFQFHAVEMNKMYQ